MSATVSQQQRTAYASFPDVKKSSVMKPSAIYFKPPPPSTQGPATIIHSLLAGFCACQSTPLRFVNDDRQDYMMHESIYAINRHQGSDDDDDCNSITVLSAKPKTAKNASSPLSLHQSPARSFATVATMDTASTASMHSDSFDQDLDGAGEVDEAEMKTIFMSNITRYDAISSTTDNNSNIINDNCEADEDNLYIRPVGTWLSSPSLVFNGLDDEEDEDDVRDDVENDMRSQEIFRPMPVHAKQFWERQPKFCAPTEPGGVEETKECDDADRSSPLASLIDLSIDDEQLNEGEDANPDEYPSLVRMYAEHSLFDLDDAESEIIIISQP